MNTLNRLLSYGIPPSTDELEDIRRVLDTEIANEEAGRPREEDVAYLCCCQLFAKAEPTDVLLIWKAKSSSFDLGCMIDVQLLCGIGLEETKQYLSNLGSEEAQAAKAYIEECEKTGDFDDWTVETQLGYCRTYFGL